jgi:hypothetical protein
MPKTYPNSRKEQWLIELSQGRTIKQIAKKSTCDMRTVKRGIEEMQGRRAAQETVAQIYRDALRGHYDRLNSALDMTIDELRLPDPYFTELAWVEIVSLPEVSQDSVDPREVGSEEIRQAEDAFSDGTLLSEHLKNGKAWKALIDWRRSQKKHRAACGRLQIRSLELLKKKTGLKAREEQKVTKPFFHGEITGDLLCRTVVKHLSEGIDIKKITEQIVADDQHGVVKYQSTPLLESAADTKKLSQYRDDLVQALDELKDSPEAAQVVSTFQQLEKILPKARNELRAIRLLGVVHGHCRLCRQFGL